MCLQRDKAARCTAKGSIKVCAKRHARNAIQVLDDLQRCHSSAALSEHALLPKRSLSSIQLFEGCNPACSALLCPAQGCCELWLPGLSLSVLGSQLWSGLHADQLVSKARDTSLASSNASTQRQGSPLAGAFLAPR